MRPALLIVDEIGYRPDVPVGWNLFSSWSTPRYERGAMILTSSRGFAEWGEVFGDPVFATALLGRLLHAFVGTEHFPFGEEDAFSVPRDDLYFAGTAEIVLNGLHRGEILAESDLPILYAGLSPCFRREAGSGGRDVRGLLRVHQFYKLEQFVICRADPEESTSWHAKLLASAETILTECLTGDIASCTR